MRSPHWLLDRFKNFDQATAIVSNDKELSYKSLVVLIESWLQVFLEIGIDAGDVIAVSGGNSPNSYALLIALLINKSIVLPISSSTQANKEKFLEMSQAKLVIELTENKDFSIVEYHAEVSNSLLLSLREEGKPGLILFSSGSSGQSKGMVLDADKMLEKLKPLRHGYRTLVFLMFDHIGGVNTILHVLSQGGALVMLQNRDPGTVCRAIENFKVELLPTTPTFLNMLLVSGLYEKYDLSSLKLITYGTEPMPVSTLNRLNALFPGIKFKQTYGLSETGILPTKSESAGSLWFLLGDEKVKYKIVDGILLLKAEGSMLGYLNAPSPFDAEDWFITGDMVETKQVNGQEYLRILGRKTELINVGGEKVYPTEVENVLLQIPNIVDVVVNGKKNPITGHVVTAKVNLGTPEDIGALTQKIRAFCIDKLEPFKIPMTIEIVQNDLYGARYKKNRQLVAQ